MSEEQNNEYVEAAVPAETEAVTEMPTEEVALVDTPAPEEKKHRFADFIAKLQIPELLQKITENKWVSLSNKICRAIMILCMGISIYLGAIGYAFDVAFITLLISLATGLYVTLLAGARVFLVRGKKRRIRKKALRTLILFGIMLFVALMLVLFSNIPYYDGRYGSSYHIHDYDAFYYDIISDAGEDVAIIREVDSDAQSIMIPLDVHGYPVKYVEGKAFVECSKLATIKTNSSHPYFKCEGGALFSADEKTLIAYPQQALRLTNSITLSSVTEIGEYAFAGSACRVVNLPNVTKIGDHAFDGCNMLSNVEAPKLTYIGEYAFAGCTQLRAFEIIDSVSYVGEGAFHGMPSTSKLIVSATASTDDWHPAWKRGCNAESN